MDPEDVLTTTAQVTEVLEEVVFFVANTIGGSDNEASAAVGQVETPADEVVQA